MQLIKALLISLAVVDLVSGQERHDVHGHDEDPTAMVAQMANPNVAYLSKSHEDSDWQVELDRKGAINLGWSLDEVRNVILFTLKIDTARTKFRHGSDVFALGLSDYGPLEEADFCLLSFDLAHSAHLRDAISRGAQQRGSLSVLSKSDSHCKLVSVNPRSGRDYGDDDDRQQLAVYKFTRPLDTCEENYFTIDNGTAHLVWFKMDGPLADMSEINLIELQRQELLGKAKNISSSFESGLTRVQLAASKLASSNNKHRARHSSASMDVRMEDYEIPAQETTYWCKLFKLPPRFEQRKFHITKYEAIVEAGNEHVVHHMELFNCVYETAREAEDLRELYEKRGGWSGECGAKDRPRASRVCRRVILAWAMGARPLEYPEQVGQSIGGPAYSPYVVLEVHYNNVARSGGLRDSSGLRFHFTHRLRQFDAGIMEVGLEYTDKNSIPPNVVAPLAGYCVSECTRAAMSSASASSRSSAEHDYGRREEHYYRGRQRTDQLEAAQQQQDDDDDDDEARGGPIGERAKLRPASEEENKTNNEIEKQKEEGIYIFAAQMHTHLAGVASWTEQVREGRLLRELQRDDHYSPHFQEIRLLPEPIHLAPGDALVHYCLYDTRARPNITLGGYATFDEMCVTYLHYYPRIELEVCKSSLDSRALNDYFAYLARDEGQLKFAAAAGGGAELGRNLSSTRRGTQIMAAAAAAAEEERLAKKSVSEKYQSIEWTARRSRELLELYASGPLSVQCNRSNGDRFPGFWNGVTPTQVHYSPPSADSSEDDSEDDDSDAAESARRAPGAQRAAAGHSRWGPQIMGYRGALAARARRRRASKCAAERRRLYGHRRRRRPA